MLCSSCGQQLLITSVGGVLKQVCTNRRCPTYAGNNLNIPRQAGESIYQDGKLSEAIPVGGTTDQVLSKASDDDFDLKWATGGGGAVSSVFGRTGAVTAQTGDYDYTEVTNAQRVFTRFNALSTSTASIANTNVDVTWNTERKKDSDFTHAANSTDITCNFDGEVEVNVEVRTTGNNRVEAILTLLIDSVAQTGAISSNYTLRDGDQNTGSVWLYWWTEVSSGEVIKINAEGDTDGTCTLTTGTRIDIKRVS